MIKSRIILVHGWGGSPEADWFPWAIKELESRGYKVVAPHMPNTDIPVISSWVDYLTSQIGELQSNDIMIGHSIGCQTILRYLERAHGQAVKAILVAPWFTLTNLENDEARQIAEPWIKTPMDFAKIKPKAKEFITIFSDNDPCVPYQENKQLFIKKLNPQIITLHNMGHITADEGVAQLPELISLLMQ